MKPGVLGIAGAALVALCLGGCAQSSPADDESATPTETASVEPSPTETSTPDPKAVALGDALSAQDDESRPIEERTCALKWAMAEMNGDYAPDCYLPGVDTDAFELESEPTSTPTAPMDPESEAVLRSLAFGLLEDASTNPNLTQEDRTCASFWMKAVTNGHTYQPTCDVPGVHTDGIFDMKPNPYDDN